MKDNRKWNWKQVQIENAYPTVFGQARNQYDPHQDMSVGGLVIRLGCTGNFTVYIYGEMIVQ